MNNAAIKPVMIVSSTLVPGTVMIDDYVRSVGHLLYLAARPELPHSFAAAQVLLSFFDPEEWAIYTPDLLICDSETFKSAVICLRGAYELKKDPRDLFQNGHEVFDQLSSRWAAIIDISIDRVLN